MSGLICQLLLLVVAYIFSRRSERPVASGLSCSSLAKRKKSNKKSPGGESTDSPFVSFIRVSETYEKKAKPARRTQGDRFHEDGANQNTRAASASC